MSREEEFPGVTYRLRTMLRLRGFWDPRTDAPDIPAFIRAYPRYNGKTVAHWLNIRKPRRPSVPRLAMLAADLQCSMTYLLLGDRVFRPTEWAYLVVARHTEEDMTVDRQIRPFLARVEHVRGERTWLVEAPAPPLGSYYRAK
jgi:hypothetical protein